jgi:hypothetical protein
MFSIIATLRNVELDLNCSRLVANTLLPRATNDKICSLEVLLTLLLVTIQSGLKFETLAMSLDLCVHLCLIPNVLLIIVSLQRRCPSMFTPFLVERRLSRQSAPPS